MGAGVTPGSKLGDDCPMLLYYGAEVEAKDAYGQTALCRIVAEGHNYTVAQLLANRADITSETLTRETPWSRAHTEGRKDTTELIKCRYPSQETLASDSHVLYGCFRLLSLEPSNIAESDGWGNVLQRSRVAVIDFLEVRWTMETLLAEASHTQYVVRT